MALEPWVHYGSLHYSVRKAQKSAVSTRVWILLLQWTLTILFLCDLGAPNGQLPFLEMDGVKLGQSVAIARFLARKFGKSFSRVID